MEFEVAVLDSLSLIVFMVSVDVEQQRTCSISEFRSCVKVEVCVDEKPQHTTAVYQSSGAV